MATYSHTTLAGAKTELSLRLGDTSKVFWTDAELGFYIKDAIRTWGAMSMAFKDRGIFTTSAGTSFYDLSSVLDDGIGNKILTRTLADRDIVNEIQYHLIEAINNWGVSTTWAGTEMFSMADVVQAIQRRRNQFLLETGQITSAAKYTSTVGVGKISLPDTTVDVRRVAWIDFIGAAESTYTNLWRVDDFQLSQFSVGWNLTNGAPVGYSVATVPETFVELAPFPAAPGKIHVVSVDSGPALDVTTGQLMGILNDFAHVIKWGALADLLGRDGPAHDPDRAKYCEQRFQDGIIMSNIATTALSGQINGNYTQICSLFDLDAAYPNWQSTSGTPQVLAMSGLNNVALYPVPDGSYSVVLDVVRNSIVPTSDSDYLQIGREYLDAILDYAQHLAVFKQSGTELQASMRLYNNFVRAAARYNTRLNAQVDMLQALTDNTSREKDQRPAVLEASNG